MTKIYSVISNKGGILKSTLCSNIAAELSKDYHTLIIDTDGQSNIAVTFGIKEVDIKPTLYDCLSKESNIEKAIITVSSNLDIITAGKGMNSFTKKMIDLHWI